MVPFFEMRFLRYLHPIEDFRGSLNPVKDQLSFYVMHLQNLVAAWIDPLVDTDYFHFLTTYFALILCGSLMIAVERSRVAARVSVLTGDCP